ncbi:MAG TPA: chlorite dismutase family protein [Gemmatimonadaceae bacterium]|nr:chlorite dismutase family protein [Gemmatimonadaceae bacterium]
MARAERPVAHPPETLEGWFSLHDSYRIRAPAGERERLLDLAARSVQGATDRLRGRGWSVVVSLVGGPADLLAIHFRETTDELEEARWDLAAVAADGLERTWTQLGVTEAGLYHLTAELAREAAGRGGSAGDEIYTRELTARAAAEKESEHVRRRLYPPPPSDMRHVSFYPMSKRRIPGQNWYALTLDERSRLMRAHGMTGRKYAGRVLQVITGTIGLSEWEWGVTLFTRDLLDVKRLVTDMRFDEASAEYADFGEFYVGRVLAPVER